MNFYRRRPLALVISLCLVLSAAASFMPGALKLVLMALAVLSVSAGVIIVRRRMGFFPSAAPYVFTAAVMAAVCLLTSFLYYNVHARRHMALENGSIRAAVTEIRRETDYSSSYTVRLESVDGVWFGGKGIIHSESALSLELGDVIEASAVFQPLDSYFGYTGSIVTSALSDGYVFVCEPEGKVELVGSSNSPEILLAKLRSYLCAVMGLYLDRDAGAMANALFLGVRDGLGVIRRDFTYLGITHLLALSGLHIAVIGNALERLLCLVNTDKRIRCVILMLFLGIYAALTGFLLSAVRAVLMLYVSYLAQAVGRKDDRVTTLFIAVMLIVLVSPGAVLDVGLQLSFCATLGVLLMTDAVERRFDAVKKEGRGARILVEILVAVGASVGATMFVMPLQWLYFGEMSIVSVPATLILSPICEGMLVLYLPYMIFALLRCHGICSVMAQALTLLYEVCEFISGELAQVSTTVSLRYPFAAPIMILCVAAVIIMMIKNVRSWLWALVPFALSVSLFFWSIWVYERVSEGNITVDYMNIGANDMFLTVSGRNAVAVDFTNGSASAVGGLSDMLAEEYITEIDTMVLTDISVRHINAVHSLLEKRVVHTVLAPAAADSGEVYLLERLAEVSQEYGADVRLYPRVDETELYVGGMKITLPRYTVIKRSVRPLSAASFEYGDTVISYLGSAAWENEYITGFADGADELIIGTNGPLYKTAPEFVLPDETETVYLANGELAGELSGWLGEHTCDVLVRDRLRLVIKGAD